MLPTSPSSALIGRSGDIQFLTELFDIAEIVVGVKVWHNTEKAGGIRIQLQELPKLSAGPITPD